MVLAVLFLFFNVYMFIQKQDIKFQDTIMQSQQMDTDRNNEKVSIPIDPTQTTNANIVTVNCSIKNDGSIPAKIVRAWLTDTTYNTISHTNILGIVLSPGEISNRLLAFTMNDHSGQFRLDIVTSRGNIISKAFP
jgi:archaellum component FlaG (FlaF/FlaG flagellin family)